MTRNGRLVATYGYDALGLRVSATTTITSKTTGSSKTTTRDYLFDLADRVIHDKVISISGQLPAGEDPETSSENSCVFANGVHFAKVEGTIGTTAEIYYYHNDHLGSPMAITDSHGNVAWSQDYLPYGGALNESATKTKTRFTFTGKELDPATGLMYYNARWYDPDLGRFLTEDTWTELPDDQRGYRVGNNVLQYNPYVYSINNPTRFGDPSGHREDYGDGSEQDRKSNRAERRAQEKESRARQREGVSRDLRERREREAKREKRDAVVNLANPIKNRIPVFNPLTNPLEALDTTRDIYTLLGGDADDIPNSEELLKKVWDAIEEAFGPFW